MARGELNYKRCGVCGALIAAEVAECPFCARSERKRKPLNRLRRWSNQRPALGSWLVFSALAGGVTGFVLAWATDLSASSALLAGVVAFLVVAQSGARPRLKAAGFVMGVGWWTMVIAVALSVIVVVSK